ncbi:MAG: hypothetical protein GY804_02910 [Alphaproteobacteria bacterium]|nr:hypothetical protein [Alphaproteobacteria bacterium]
MAIKIFQRYSPRANAPNSDYPQGSVKNESSPGLTDGTPLDQALTNDYEGFTAKLLAEGGVSYSGNPDTATASDRMTALNNIINASTDSIFNFYAKTTGRSKNSPAGTDLDTLNTPGLYGVVGGSGFVNAPLGVTNYGFAQVWKYADTETFIQRYTPNDGTITTFMRHGAGSPTITWTKWRKTDDPLELNQGVSDFNANTPPTKKANFDLVQCMGKRIQRSAVDTTFAQQFPLEATFYKTQTATGGQIHVIRQVSRSGAHDNIYIAGRSDGKFSRSTDSGATWSDVTPPGTLKAIYGIACSQDGSLCVAVGSTGKILRSTDQGASWTEITPPAGASSFRDICMSDDKTKIIAVGTGGSFKRWSSTDQGLTFTGHPPPATVTDFDLYACYINGSGSFGLIGGIGGTLQLTVDLVNYQVVGGRGATPSSGRRYPTFCTDSQAVLAIHGDAAGSSILATTSSGYATFTFNETGDFRYPMLLSKSVAATSARDNGAQLFDCFVAKNSNYALAVGSDGSLYKTDDAGKSWICPYTAIQKIPDTVTISSCCIADLENKYIVGDSAGNIYTAGLSAGFNTPYIGPSQYATSKYVGN